MIGRIVNYIRKEIRIFRAKLYFLKKQSYLGKVIDIDNYNYLELEKNVRIKDYSKIICYEEYAGETFEPYFRIGENVIINEGFFAFITSKCIIGKDTLIARNCFVLTENHGFDPGLEIPFRKQKLSHGPVLIGNNCWIGANVVFLPGSGIGDNSVVAAGAIVNKMFPSNVIIGGVPARIIKEYDFRLNKWLKVNNE